MDWHKVLIRQLDVGLGCLNFSSKTLLRDNEKERGKGVSLPDSLGRKKGLDGGTIKENRE